jgi:hypothetical protein
VFRDFIEKARPATYNGVFIVSATGSFGFDDSTGAVPSAAGGFSDATAAVPGGGPFAFVIPF